jgi:predicted nucleic-acid-binding Zn-ribbon protein
MSQARACPGCGQATLYVSTPVTAEGGLYSYLRMLPGLSGWFSRSKMRVVVCRTCGLAHFYADEATRARLKQSRTWTAL